MLYDVLDDFNSADRTTIKNALIYTLQIILQRNPQLSTIVDTSKILSTQYLTQYIVDSILQYCSGGESAVIIAGSILRILYGKSVDVHISQVNQAGSSSKAVGDIDLIRNGLKFCTIEVKDKTFTEQDITHAARIAISANVRRLLFIIGASVPESSLPNIQGIEENLTNTGFDISSHLYTNLHIH
jgi:hypothetical protein